MQQKTQALQTEKISTLLFRLALPAIMAQVINVLYNIVDRIYIGNIPDIGAVALTGVGICFPILIIISAFSAFVGMGGAPLAAIKLGEKDQEGAEKILGNSVIMLLCISLVLTVVFLIFGEPLLMLFGASANTVGYGKAYLNIYLLGTVFVQLSLGLNSFITTQGFARTAMTSVLVGAVTNIILDPIFIFGFNMGVEGAALATIISQALSACWVLSFLLGKKSTLKIRRKNLKLERKIVYSSLALGSAPFIMQSTESLVQIVFNVSLLHYGNDLYVGSMTIILSVMQLITLPLSGLSQGAQPIISYNYGAKNADRVKETFKYLIITSLTFSTLACLVCQFFPGVLVSVFSKDTELLLLAEKGLRIFMVGIFAFGAQQACQGTFLALGQAKISAFLAMLRKIILLIPLAIVLPMFMGVNGIYLAEAVADVMAAAVTVCFFAYNFKRILSRRIEEI